MTRVIGPTGSRRRRRFLLVVPLAMVAALVLALTGSALNTTLNQFEIEGNLVAATTNGSSEDWVNSTNTGADSPSAALQCTVGSCAPANVTDGSGQGTGNLFRDDLKVDPDRTTFTQGDKENDFASASVSCPASGPCTSAVPYHVVTGGVPPNKDDLFDITTNSFLSGNQSELDLGMVRTNNNGSSHVDFELNRANWTPGGSGGTACATNTTGITGFQCPIRTEGDLLISFEISPSSTTPPVEVKARYFVWDLPGGTDANTHGRGSVACEGPLIGNENTCPWEEIAAPSGTVLLTAVNGSDFNAAPWGSRLPNGTATSTYPAGGWFEAGIDLDALGFQPSCPGFGTASAKARSSGSSVTSALTDLAGPFPVDLNNCANIIVKKVTVPSPDPTDSTFGYTASYDADGFSLKNGQQNDSGPLSPGTYSVSESTIPTGFTLTSATCDDGSPVSAISLQNLETVTCTFTNTLQRGAIKITKTQKNVGLGTGDQPHAGVQFSIVGPSPSTTSRPATTGSDGTVCVGNLDFGSYTVTETVPANYVALSTNPQTVSVSANSTCGDGNEAPASFQNMPLSKITVDFDSLIPGATTATIECTGDASAQNLPDATPRVLGNGTTTLVPGTYTCTVVIDP
jgi:hypothetical protein